jgi:inosose dehydratase
VIAVANAPCSYGASEITVGIDPNVPKALKLLDDVAQAGYAGIDLGPLGYPGEGDQLRARPDERELSLAGGYFAVPFSKPDTLQDELARLDQLLGTFDAAGGSDNGIPRPRPTLADAGSESRSAYPGRAVNDHSLGWDDAGWKRFADALARIVDRCRERGTSRRSIRIRRRTSRRRGRSSGCWTAATSACASTPVTCCSVAATRSPLLPAGASGSTTCTSRTHGWT